VALQTGARTSAARPQRGQPPLGRTGASCRDDKSCAVGYYCGLKVHRCKKVHNAVNIAYLIYLSGNRRFLSVFGLYMHKLGPKGFRMLFPFYWSFWSKKQSTRVIFPFVARWHNHETGRTDTLVGPVHVWRRRKAHGFNFWPFVFYANYGRKGKRFTLIPFGHYQRIGSWKGYGFLTPIGFVYSSKSPRYRSWGLFPWAFGRATPRRAWSWEFPLNFYWRHGRNRHYLGFPLLYVQRSPERNLTFMFPFIWSWGGPLRQRTIIFPIGYRSWSPRRSYTQVLNFYYYRRGAKRYAGLVPLFFYSSDRRSRSRHVTLFPFLYYGYNGKTAHSVLVSPLLSWSKTRDARWWFWSVPPILSYRTPYSGTDVALPFYWRYFNKQTGVNVLGVLPFVYYKDRFQRNSVLFPFWWNFRHRATGAYVRVAFPLFYQSRSVEGRTVTVAGPAFAAWGAGKPWQAGLAPLLFFGGGYGRRHFVLFPALWHFANRRKGTSTTVVGPAYWSKGPHRWAAGLAPLFFAGRNKDRRYHIVFPLFWHLAHRDRHLAVFGPLYAKWSRHSWGFGLAPLAFIGGGRDRNYQIFPFLFGHWYDRRKDARTVVAGPAYYWRRRSDWGWGIAPFAFFSRRYRKGLVSSRFMLFPFAYSSYRMGKELLVTPLGGYSKTKDRMTAVAGPVIWHRGPKYRGWAVLPWVYHWRNRETKTTTTLAFPFVRQVSPKQAVTVTFPFLWSFVRPKERSLFIFPFYWRLRQKGRWKADVLFPFYWNIRKGSYKLLAVGPYYRRRSARGGSDGFFPLVHYSHYGKKRRLLVLPFLWYSRDDAKKTKLVVSFPYFETRKANRAHAGVVPLAFWGHRPGFSYRVGIPLYWDFTKKDRRVLFAGPFFYERKGETRGGGLAPLLWVRHGGGVTQFSLFPLIHVNKTPTKLAVYTTLAGYEKNHVTGKSFGYVGPYLWGDGPRRRWDVLFPLLWRFRNKRLHRTRMLIPPLLYWGSHSPDRKVDIVFPLFWMRRTVTSKTVVVFPFWWDSHKYYWSRTTAVFPFFYRSRHYADNSTSWFFPTLTWIKKSPRRLSVVSFPILWHFSRSRRSTTVVFPLYWDFKRPGRRSTIAFPFFWRFRRGDRTHTVVFPFYWHSENRKNAFTGILNTFYWKDKKYHTYRFYFFPLFDFGRTRPGDVQWSVLGGLFGYKRVGRNRYLKLFFFSIRLKPVPLNRKSGAAVRRNKHRRGQLPVTS